MIFGNSYNVAPKSVCFIVKLINRGPKQLGRNLKSFGKELPCPRNSLVLEIISKREVTEHLKIRAVTGSVSNSLKVGRSYALLAGANSITRRNLLTRKELLHRRHTRVYKQKRFVIVGNKREAWQTKMPLALKKGEIFFS